MGRENPRAVMRSFSPLTTLNSQPLKFMALLPESQSEKQERPIGPLNVSPAGDVVTADVVEGDAEEYVDGFSWKTVIGALFIGFIMMPGSIYLGLIAGQGMGQPPNGSPSSCSWKWRGAPIRR